jgi:hypothetical protein
MSIFRFVLCCVVRCWFAGNPWLQVGTLDTVAYRSISAGLSSGLSSSTFRLSAIPHKYSVTTQYVGRPFANAERDHDFQFGCLIPVMYHRVRRFGQSRLFSSCLFRTPIRRVPLDTAYVGVEVGVKRQTMQGSVSRRCSPHVLGQPAM